MPREDPRLALSRDYRAALRGRETPMAAPSATLQGVPHACSDTRHAALGNGPFGCSGRAQQRIAGPSRLVAPTSRPDPIPRPGDIGVAAHGSRGRRTQDAGLEPNSLEFDASRLEMMRAAGLADVSSLNLPISTRIVSARSNEWTPPVFVTRGRREGSFQCNDPDFHPSCADQDESDDCCNPVGPPYSPPCQAGDYYCFHGNQLTRVPNCSTTYSTAPYRFVGRIDTGSGKGTGTVIAKTPTSMYVLTAAHVVRRAGSEVVDRAAFSLCQYSETCRPYGNVYARRAWWPIEWEAKPAGLGVDSRAYDYAIVEFQRPTGWISDAGAPRSILLTNLVLTPSYVLLDAVTVGYACGRGPDPIPDPTPQTPPDSGICRTSGSPYITPPVASYLEVLGDTDGGAVLVSNVEGTSGMSGGPMYAPPHWSNPRLIGVLVGSPCGLEPGTSTVNWSAALTVDTHQRIIAAVLDGRHDRLHTHEFVGIPAPDDPECLGLCS